MSDRAFSMALSGLIVFAVGIAGLARAAGWWGCMEPYESPSRCHDGMEWDERSGECYSLDRYYPGCDSMLSDIPHVVRQQVVTPDGEVYDIGSFHVRAYMGSDTKRHCLQRNEE